MTQCELIVWFALAWFGSIAVFELFVTPLMLDIAHRLAKRRAELEWEKANERRSKPIGGAPEDSHRGRPSDG